MKIRVRLRSLVLNLKSPTPALKTDGLGKVLMKFAVNFKTVGIETTTAPLVINTAAPLDTTPGCLSFVSC